MAGNIIPAIATTNAIVAGVQVLQAFKLLRKDTLVAVLPTDITDAERYVRTYLRTYLFLNIYIFSQLFIILLNLMFSGLQRNYFVV